MKTYSLKKKDIKRKWHLFDLKGKIIGRTATTIAQLLQGKDKVYFTPHLDCGDYVVVINASQVKVSGKKRKNKLYYRHSGYPGGLKKVTFEQQLEKDPTKIVKWAVKNMLPKNKLRKKRLTRLRVFSNSDHCYEDKFEIKSKIKNKKTKKKKN